MKTDYKYYDDQQASFVVPDLTGKGIHSHGTTRSPFQELGKQCGERYPYLPTYVKVEEAGGYIDKAHQRYDELPLNGVQIVAPIEGSLRPADALKLYEMAYYSKGPILELGTYRGLSTSILSESSKKSGSNYPIFTVDLSKDACRLSAANLHDHGLAENVAFMYGNACTVARNFAESQFRFGFAFVDHSHAYDPVRDVATTLADLILPEGFVLFHDYQDKRNVREESSDYGVAQAVLDGLSPSTFEFMGCYGCSSLWRRKKE